MNMGMVIILIIYNSLVIQRRERYLRMYQTLFAAFMIPVLERLMYRERGKNKAAVRCVVLVPTRELGVQCADVARKLAAYMDVRISLIVGMSHATSTR